MTSSGASYEIYRRLPVPVQNLLVSVHGSIRWRHEASKEFQALVARLEEQQFSSAADIAEYQAGRLAEVLIAARATEHYSRILPSPYEMRRDPFGVLASVPVLSKEEVRRDPRRFVSASYRGRLTRHGTSGTTGTPLQAYWTDECIDMERALIWRQRSQTGLRLGRAWRGMLGGHPIVPLEARRPPFWRVNRPAKQLYLSTYHLSRENAPHYLEALESFGVRVLEGYPSVLYALALGMDGSGLQYPLEGIYYGAEPLLDHQSQLLEKVFQCHVWDYYGLTERTASASEFECRNGLHENWEACRLEVAGSSGEMLPEGDYGELVGTSLVNLGFPLLRYMTGDMTRFLQGACTCRRCSRRIARIDTKREDLLVMPDGSLLSASNLTFPFKEVGNILESQIYQGSVDRIEIRLVPAPGYSAGDGQRLLEGLKKLLPGEVEVVIVPVDRIARIAGKSRFCLSEVEDGAEGDPGHGCY